MSPKTYPPGTVRRLLTSDLVTSPTREVLRKRLEADTDDAPRFFDAATLMTLRAACSRLIPQLDRAESIDVASCIDKRLAENMCDGWRYDAMPPDAEAYRLGLRGLDESAQAKFNLAFHELGAANQDAVLRAVQAGTAEGRTWQTLPPNRFFEELLVEVAESYYSHPLAQEEIGYVGMADAHGWQAINLNQLEAHEPQASENQSG